MAPTGKKSRVQSAGSKQARKDPSPDDDLQLPMNKTNPIWIGVGIVAVLAIGGYAVFKLAAGSGSKQPAPAASVQMPVDDKAKEEARREHLELTAKAMAALEEKKREQAAASASAAAAPAPPGNTPVAASEPAAPGPAAQPAAPAAAKPKPKGPSADDLEALDQLGKDTNSQLQGP